MKRFEFWNRLFNSGENAGRPAKRKEISIFVGTALIAVIAIVITACPGAAPEDPVTNEYTVSYDVNGGDSTAPAAETVTDGGTAAKPADPTRSGYVFNGWFDADTGGNEYTFGTAVTADITLYAQWTIMTYTVSYNVNRGDSTEPSTETVEHGGTATRPTTDPTWTGYTFTGWFDAASGGSVYNFGTEVTADITLYAQWTPPLTISGLSPLTAVPS